MELWVCFLEEVMSKRGGCVRWLAGEEQASQPRRGWNAELYGKRRSSVELGGGQGGNELS